VSLDNILVSTRFKINKYTPGKNCISDHYPLFLNYQMNLPAASGAGNSSLVRLGGLK